MKVEFKSTLFWDLLQLALIVLKLCGIINWKWIWVFTPLWITLIVAIIFSVVLFIINFKGRK